MADKQKTVSVDDLGAPDAEKIADAQERLANDSNALVAQTTTGPVYAPRGVLVEPEPGHKGLELAGGAHPYDPNAARRAAEGRGPGLQDSEINQPAHWVQPDQVAAQDAAAEARRPA